jgi:glucokinase
VTELVVADIGGTHCRFAIATQGREGRIALTHAAKLKVAEHASLQSAFETYRAGLGRPVPDHAAIAVAAPVDGELLKLTNNPWVIRPAHVAERLGLEGALLVNDFAAVAHAVAVLGPDGFAHVAGPEAAPGGENVISVIGPGTGLGVAVMVRGNPPRVIPTEGGHIDFAPLDSLEDKMLQQLRDRFRRVSVERVVAGPGLANILAALAAIEGRAVPHRDDSELWRAALEEKDALAEAAFDRWCLALGSVAGDLALAQGADAVVLAGGMLPRVQHLLGASGFHARFMAKGRFEARMATIPIRRVTHPEPGLMGAAAAWLAREAA